MCVTPVYECWWLNRETQTLWRKAAKDTNWADINRGLRIQWCRNLGTKRLYFVSFDISFLSLYTHTHTFVYTHSAIRRIPVHSAGSTVRCLSWRWNDSVDTLFILAFQIRNWQHKQFRLRIEKPLCTKLFAFKLKIPSIGFRFSILAVSIFASSSSSLYSFVL